MEVVFLMPSEVEGDDILTQNGFIWASFQNKVLENLGLKMLNKNLK